MTAQPQCVLDIDMGNTRIKWRLCVGQSCLASGASTYGDQDMWQQIAVGVKPPDRIRVSSVACAHYVEALSDEVQQRWQKVPEFAQVRQVCAGVTNSYDDVNQLGIDRWLACIAAYQYTGRSCLVVDCGSAITAELIDNRGHHLGGYIVPGLGLMQRALHSGTGIDGKRPLLPVSILSPGRNTDEAVNHGLILMVLGVINSAKEQLAEMGGEPDVVITGGDALMVLPHLHERVLHKPDLVLEGLSFVLP